MNTSFFDILAFQFSSLPDGHFIPPHLHHFHQLDVILAGRITIEIEGRAPLLGIAGQAWLIPPLVRHAYRAQENFHQATFKLQLAPRYWKVFGRNFHSFEMRHTLSDEVNAIATLLMAQCATDINKTISESQVGNNHTDSLRDRLWLLTVHSFSRSFKSVFGMAPAAYRKMPQDV